MPNQARWYWSLAAALVWIAVPTRAHAVSWQRPLGELVHRSWSTEDGLPGVTVTALAQTPDGYIWIGTQAGLVRFDGHSFFLFDPTTTPALANGSWISALAVDADGSLWMGTVGAGLLRLQRGEFTAYTTRDGLASNYVRAITLGSDRTVWVGSVAGVDALRGGRVVDFPARARLVGKEAGALYADVDGSLWIGVPNVGLSWISGAEYRAFDAASGLTGHGAEKVIRDKQGTLWLTSGDGILRQEGDRFVSAGLGNESALSLHVDSNDALWIGRGQGGLSVAHHGVVQQGGQSATIAGLAGERISCMLEDREGTLWLGTESAGLHALREGTFQVIGLPDKPLPVFCALEARDGSLWMGTLYSGVLRWRNGETSWYGEEQGVGGGGVYALHEDEQGGLWVGTAHALSKWTGSGFIEVPAETKEGGGRLVFAIAGRHDSLWVAIQGAGLLHIEEDKTRLFTKEDGLPSVDFFSLYEGRDGVLWIGTQAGLARWVNGRITPFQPTNGTRNPAVNTFYEDERGALWFGAIGGIGRYHHGTLTMLPRIPGLPADAMLINGDNQGNLWVGAATGAGLYRVPREDLERSAETTAALVRVRSFDESDGLKSRETNGGRGLMRLRDGRMAFSTMNGLALVNPSREVRNNVEPLVAIQRMEADGTELRPGEVQLVPRGARHLRIDYTALSYVSPKRVRYRYKLDGYDPTWVEAGADRSAHYTNLAPGAYRFVVIADNGDGIWSRSGAQVDLRQEAFFYQTAWFYVLVAGTVAAGTLTTYRYRIGKVRAVAIMLEKRVVERTAELHDALRELRDKDERLQTDLMQARAFQQALLPKLPRGGRLSFGALYEPAELVGGDIYDVAELRSGLQRIFLADTTGHGVQASLRTIMIKTEYDRLKHRETSPGRLLSALNAALLTNAGGRVRCTACCIDIHADESGEIRIVYANAAHPEVLHLGEVRRLLYSPGMYMGFTNDVTYTDIETELRPGETLVGYSDGATEEEDASGQPFGLDRLAETLEAALAKGCDTAKVLQAAHNAIKLFKAPHGSAAALRDDVTMIMIHRALG